LSLGVKKTLVSNKKRVCAFNATIKMKPGPRDLSGFNACGLAPSVSVKQTHFGSGVFKFFTKTSYFDFSLKSLHFMYFMHTSSLGCIFNNYYYYRNNNNRDHIGYVYEHLGSELSRLLLVYNSALNIKNKYLKFRLFSSKEICIGNQSSRLEHDYEVLRGTKIINSKLLYSWEVVNLVRLMTKSSSKNKVLGIYLVNQSSFLSNDFYFPSTDNVRTFNNILALSSCTTEHNGLIKSPSKYPNLIFSKTPSSVNTVTLYRQALLRSQLIQKNLLFFKALTAEKGKLLLLDIKAERRKVYMISKFFSNKLISNRYSLKNIYSRLSILLRPFNSKFLKRRVLSTASYYKDLHTLYNPKYLGYTEFSSKHA